jgi:hypothetical protein
MVWFVRYERPKIAVYASTLFYFCVYSHFPSFFPPKREGGPTLTTSLRFPDFQLSHDF